MGNTLCQPGLQRKQRQCRDRPARRSAMADLRIGSMAFPGADNGTKAVMRPKGGEIASGPRAKRYRLLGRSPALGGRGDNRAAACLLYTSPSPRD